MKNSLPRQMSLMLHSDLGVTAVHMRAGDFREAWQMDGRKMVEVRKDFTETLEREEGKLNGQCKVSSQLKERSKKSGKKWKCIGR